MRSFEAEAILRMHLPRPNSSHYVSPSSWESACLLLLALAGAGACSSGAGAGEGGKVASGVRSLVIEHEECAEGGRTVQAIDVNGDKKPDIRRVFDSSTKVELCRVADLDRDGVPDMFEYFAPDGVIRRREADYNDDGVVNSIDYFEGGKLVRRELDTSNLGRLDTWDFFDPATGQRTKRERDSNGDGRVDQWWTWSSGKLTIEMDRNGDGLPEPDATMVLAPDGTPAAADGKRPAATSDAGAPAVDPAPSEPAAPSDGPAPGAAEADAGASRPKRGGARR